MKLTVFVTDMEISRAIARRETGSASVTPPAAAVTLVEASKLYARDFMIEIEEIAALRR